MNATFNESQEDLQQYITNLLYAAYDRLMTREEFDKWVEEQVGLIGEYLESTVCIP